MTVGKRHLVCPYGCQPGRFELLGGAVYVDPRGSYLSHEERLASFRCEVCGAVAVDLAAAATTRARELGEIAEVTLTCPACGTSLLAPMDPAPTSQLECPECQTRFSPEEGNQHLLGSFSSEPEDPDRLDL